MSNCSWTIPKELNWMQEVRNNGYTALMWACQYGRRDVVKLLLEATEVDITYPMQWVNKQITYSAFVVYVHFRLIWVYLFHFRWCIKIWQINNMWQHGEKLDWINCGIFETDLAVELQEKYRVTLCYLYFKRLEWRRVTC